MQNWFKHMMQSFRTLIGVTLVGCLAVVLYPAAAGATAKERYLSADACYQKLIKNERKKKYRDNWLKCINKFDSVYRYDPSGSWAAAGLFMSGRLYGELYGLSYSKKDKAKALDYFKRVIKGYPKSRYRGRAKKKISLLTTPAVPKQKKKKAPAPPKKTKKTVPEFSAAESCYGKLKTNPKKQKYRENWLRCIRAYETAYTKDPSGPAAAESLYMAGKLYEDLYRKSYRKADKLASLDRYDRVLNQFSDTEFGRKARKAMGMPVPEPPAVSKSPTPPKPPAPKAPKEETDEKVDVIAGVIEKSYEAQSAEEKPAPTPGQGYAVVQGLRYWSNPSYTRVVIDADRVTDFRHRLLKKDPSIQKPERLYVDLENTKLGSDVQKTIPINDNLLSDARAGQHSPENVRVVIDIKSFKTYKIFSLRNPFRIVIDVWGKETGKRKAVAATAPGKRGKPTPGALAKQLALGVSRIVVDPGHGGKDFGAPGYLKGVHEKNVVLSIAKRLAKKIRKKLGCEVIMTRTTDRYLTLEERTAIANTKNADLFISIHTNSARSRRAYGLETYFLNLATDDDAIRVAARENATSRKNISDLQTILSDLMQNAKINESSRLAGFVNRSLHTHMKKRYSRIKSKGVKQAPFYVLLGAQMPAILIETSFISNPRECKRLVSKSYQEHLSDGIVEGIRQYIREISPRAQSTVPSFSGGQG